MPERVSSANSPIVNPGIKKNNDQYAIPKKDCKLACPTINTSDPESHVKKPLNPRNAINNIYAINELKNDLNSLLAIIHICFMLKVFKVTNSLLIHGRYLPVLFQQASSQLKAIPFPHTMNK